jgi:hypothetical protein
MISPGRQAATKVATVLGTTAACAALLWPGIHQIMPKEYKILSPVAGVFAGALAVVLATRKQNSRYKRRPEETTIAVAPPTPTVDPKIVENTTIKWPKDSNQGKTLKFLLVPEGYSPETLASENFQMGVQRIQSFLQAHLPAELFTVGLAFPEQSIPSVTPDPRWGHKWPEDHPLLDQADAVVILLNGEQYPLNPHACFDGTAAVTYGPTPAGAVDFATLLTALHETLHLCPTEPGARINDSYDYRHDRYAWKHQAPLIRSFNNSGFMPHKVQDEWPETLITQAVVLFDPPLVPIVQNWETYLAISNRAHIMDHGAIEDPLALAIFQATGGQLIPPYMQHLIYHGAVNALENDERLTPAEAASCQRRIHMSD